MFYIHHSYLLMIRRYPGNKVSESLGGKSCYNNYSSLSCLSIYIESHSGVGFFEPYSDIAKVLRETGTTLPLGLHHRHPGRYYAP